MDVGWTQLKCSNPHKPVISFPWSTASTASGTDRCRTEKLTGEQQQVWAERRSDLFPARLITFFFSGTRVFVIRCCQLSAPVQDVSNSLNARLSRPITRCMCRLLIVKHTRAVVFVLSPCQGVDLLGGQEASCLGHSSESMEENAKTSNNLSVGECKQWMLDSIGD